MTRAYTNGLLMMIEDDLLDRDTVILALVDYMSEDEVRDCAVINGFQFEEEELL